MIIIIFLAIIFLLILKTIKFKKPTPPPPPLFKGTVPNYNVLNKYFDKIVCVTLPERKERIKKIFNRWGLRVEIHNAYLKKNINKPQLIKEGFLDPDCLLHEGKICCHYSHTQVYRKFMKSPHLKNILIFEDDLDEGPENVQEFNKMIIPYLINLPKNWDYVNFGPCHEKCENNIDNDYFQKSQNPKCRQAVAFNKKAMSKILNETSPMTNIPGDRMIAELIGNNEFNAYSSSHIVFRQKREELGTTLANFGDARQCSIYSS